MMCLYLSFHTVCITVNCGTISLTPSSLPNGVVGRSYSDSIRASGTGGSYTYTISSGSLPAGVLFGTDGIFSGIPTTSGTYNFDVTATDGNNCTGVHSYSITVNCATITLSALSNAQNGVAYNNTIIASGGHSPYRYHVTSGSIPTGLALDTLTGVLSGTPTANGTFTFDVTATDSYLCTGVRSYSVSVSNCPVFTFMPSTLGNGSVGLSYQNTITANNGSTPYTYAVTSGSLPDGLTLSSGGQLSGAPTSSGVSNFTIEATDSIGCRGSVNYRLVVCGTLTLDASLPAGTIGTPYLIHLSTSGGTAPYNYTMMTGTLPSGLGMTPDGTIQGTPFISDTSVFGITVTDTNGCSGSAMYTVVVSCPTLSVTNSAPDGFSGSTYNHTYSVTGGRAPYTTTQMGGSLPTSLTLSAEGLLSGTPSENGTFIFTFSVADYYGCSTSHTDTVVIAGCPTITLSSLTNGTIGVAYSKTISVNGGIEPYTYAHIAGTLPPGLTFTNGVLSGTPTALGSTSFTIKATDANGCVGTQVYDFNVLCPTITLAPASLPAGVKNIAYPSRTITASGGAGSYAYAVTTGSLPTGLTLTAGGVLSGTPTVSGSFAITVTATDANSCTGTANYTIVIGLSSTVTWTGGAGTNLWSNGANWSTGAMPTSINDVVLDHSTIVGNYTVEDSLTNTACKSLIVGSGVTVVISGSTAPVLSVGDGGVGNDDILIQNGGRVNNMTTTLSGNSFTLAVPANDRFKIENGGYYLHNTPRSFATPFPTANCIFDSLSTVEYGPFATTNPPLGGRGYGNLVFSATTDKTVSVVLASNVTTIKGTLTLTGPVSFYLKWTNAGASTIGNIENNGDSLFFTASSSPFTIGNITNNGTIAAATSTSQFTVTGNIVNNGVLDFGTGTGLKLQGSSAQVLSGTGTKFSVNNLTINNAHGVTANTDLTVAGGVFTLTLGNVTTAGNTSLALSTGVTTSRTDGWVNGNFKKFVAAGSTVQQYEIGDITNYTPVSVIFGTVSVGGDLTARTTLGSHAQLASSGLSLTKKLNRYFTIHNSGIAFDTYSAVFSFVSGDVDAGADPLQFIAKKYDGVSWSDVTPGFRTLASIEVTGMTSFSDFAFGQIPPPTHTITATAGANGTITPSGSVVVDEGSNQRFTFTPSGGYRVDSVFVDGVYVDSIVGYTFGNVVTTHTIHVQFIQSSYTITVTTGAHGAANPTGSVPVSYGANKIINFIPNSGYHVDSLFVDGGYVGAPSSYEFTSITSGHTVYVTFAPNYYSLTINYYGTGSFVKSPDQLTYAYGTLVHVTAIPDYGWKFTKWLGDATGTLDTITIMMDSAKSITGQFDVDPVYQVTYRTVHPDSLALSRDQVGKPGKEVAKKAYRVEFSFNTVADSDNVDGFHFELANGIDNRFDFTITPTPLSVTEVAKSKMKKWNVKFAIPLLKGDVVTVSGYGDKGSLQKVASYWWTKNDLIFGKKGKNPTFTTNILRLPMPNRINIAKSTFESGTFVADGGMVVGTSRLDSAKVYGWVIMKKYTDLMKSLSVVSKGIVNLHDGIAQGFEKFGNAKNFVGKQTSLPPTKQDNKLFASVAALQLSIKASALGITPVGLGELIFQDTTANTLNGLMLKQIVAQANTMLTGYPGRQFEQTAVYTNLYSTINRVLVAFEGAMDTTKFSDSLKVKGTTQLLFVPFLRANSSVEPTRLTFATVTEEQLPEVYALLQNYPNPFNPTTTIGFELPVASTVTLTVYNMLGQEVARVLDHQFMDEGTQEVEFNASQLSSGVYFYRVTTESTNEDGMLATFTQMKKMMLIK